MDDAPRSAAPGAFVAAAVFTLLFSGSAIVSLIARRKTFPIFGRELTLLVPFSIANVLISIHFALSPILDYSCVFTVIAEVDLPLFGLNAFALRLIRYWFLYFAAQERFAKQRDPGAPQWFNGRKHWVSSKRIAVMLICSSVVTIGISNFSFYLQPNVVARGCANGLLNTSLFVVNIIQVIEMFVFAYTGYKIRQIIDGFHFKTELKYGVYVSIPTTIVWIMHGRLDYVSGFALTQFLMVVFLQALQAVFCCYPLAKSFQYQMWLAREKANWSTSSHQDTPLIEILTSEVFAKELVDFEQHLVRELNFENYELWRKAYEFPRFAEGASALEAARGAMSIYKEFIQVGSTAEANISAKTRSATIDALRNSIANFDDDPEVEHVTLTGRRIDANVFDKVLKAMYALLSKDPYVRWKILQQKKLEEPVRELESAPEKVWHIDRSSRHGGDEDAVEIKLDSKEADERDVELSPVKCRQRSLDADELADIAAFQNPGAYPNQRSVTPGAMPTPLATPRCTKSADPRARDEPKKVVDAADDDVVLEVADEQALHHGACPSRDDVSTSDGSADSLLASAVSV